MRYLKYLSAVGIIAFGLLTVGTPRALAQGNFGVDTGAGPAYGGNDQGYDDQAYSEPPPAPPPPAPTSETSDTDELEKLAALHANGTLTDEEFAAAKAKVLGI